MMFGYPIKAAGHTGYFNGYPGPPVVVTAIPEAAVIIVPGGAEEEHIGYGPDVVNLRDILHYD
jgi:hypothetical protein